LCFRSRFRLLIFFGWDIRTLLPSIVSCHSWGAPPLICVPASPFLHANVLGAHSPALPPQLPAGQIAGHFRWVAKLRASRGYRHLARVIWTARLPPCVWWPGFRGCCGKFCQGHLGGKCGVSPVSQPP
jgi:hypothetical protein